MLVIGEKESVSGSVAVRHSTKGDLGMKTVAEFIADVTCEVRERRI